MFSLARIVLFYVLCGGGGGGGGILVNAFRHTHYWFPIVPVNSYDFTGPSKIMVLGKEFVVWAKTIREKNSFEYIVQDNKCPHRCAPLSEGYYDEETGNLRCSYHGWEFNLEGSVVNIPQSKYPFAYDTNSRISVQNYETTVYGGILWAFLGNRSDPLSQLEYEYGHPKHICKCEDDDFVFMRELPYDYIFLLENLLDPAHVPFAHHTLQSTRDKAGPVDVQILAENETSFIVSFADEIMTDGNTKRNGTMSVRLPCYYCLENVYPKNSILDKLHIMTVPVMPGKSRVIIKYEYNRTHPLYNVFRFTPRWLQHALTNRFLDSDTLLLHEQERLLRQDLSEPVRLYDYSKQYNLMTQSDMSVSRYMQWMKKQNDLEIPYLCTKSNMREQPDMRMAMSMGERVDRKNILDRYTQHTMTCRYCKDVLARVQNVQLYGTMIGFGVFAWYSDVRIFVLILFNWSLMEKIKRMLIFEDYVHNDI
jgi:phenylpropionate dioxygenase-like ring-hydroxylating dioxygenase large terminal subunit